MGPRNDLTCARPLPDESQYPARGHSDWRKLATAPTRLLDPNVGPEHLARLHCGRGLTYSQIQWLMGPMEMIPDPNDPTGKRKIKEKPPSLNGLSMRVQNMRKRVLDGKYTPTKGLADDWKFTEQETGTDMPWGRGKLDGSGPTITRKRKHAGVVATDEEDAGADTEDLSAGSTSPDLKQSRSASVTSVSETESGSASEYNEESSKKLRSTKQRDSRMSIAAITDKNSERAKRHKAANGDGPKEQRDNRGRDGPAEQRDPLVPGTFLHDIVTLYAKWYNARPKFDQKSYKLDELEWLQLGRAQNFGTNSQIEDFCDTQAWLHNLIEDE